MLTARTVVPGADGSGILSPMNGKSLNLNGGTGSFPAAAPRSCCAMPGADIGCRCQTAGIMPPLAGVRIKMGSAPPLPGLVFAVRCRVLMRGTRLPGFELGRDRLDRCESHPKW